MFQFMEIFGEVMRIVTFQGQVENPSQRYEEGRRRVSRPDRCTAPFRR